MGDQERALESGKRALAIATDRRDFPLQVLTNAYLGAAYHALGDYRLSIETLRGTLASLEGDLIHERFGLPGPASMFFRTWLVWSLAKVGDFAEGIARGEEGIRIAESVDQPLSLTVSNYALGFLYLHKAAFDKATPLLERSLDLCRTWNLRAWFPLIASSLGSALGLSGRVAEGVPLLEQAVERAFAMRLIVNQSSRLAWLGEGLLLGGRGEDAMRVTQRALELARAHRERGHEAYALRLVGEIAAERDPPDSGTAEAHYRQALALAEELGMRPLLAQCHLGLGTLFRRAGRLAEARAELSAATRLLRALEMTFWLGHAEAEEAKVG